MGLFPRWQGDKIRTALLIDHLASAGSIVLYAGWLKRGKPFGAPNGGYAAVPIWLLGAVVNHPWVAPTYFCPEGAPTTVH